MIEKTCKICHETKSIKNFYVHKDFKDGYMSYCKQCKIEKSKVEYQKREYYRVDYSITTLPNSKIREFEKIMFNVRMNYA